MRKVKNLVKRVMRKVKKLFQRVIKRLIALLFVTALLLSLVGISLYQSEEIPAKAIAGIDDVTYWIAVEYLKIVTALAGASAGASNSEMLTSADKEGITSWSDARGYVHDSMSGNSSFSQFMESLNVNAQEVYEMELCVASAFFMGGYIFSKKFMNEIFGSNTDVITHDPNRDNWDYDPARDGWDKDKYDQLTEEEKWQVFGTQLWEDLRDWCENTPIWMAPPDPDYDFDDDDDDEEIREKLKEKFNDKGELVDQEGNPYVLDDSVISGAFGTPLYNFIYGMVKRTNQTEARAHLTYADPEEDTDTFHYSFQDWQKERDIIYMESANLNPSSTTFQYLDISFDDTFFGSYNPNLALYSDSRIYPCLYWDDDGVPWLGMTTDKGLWRCDYAIKIYTKYISSNTWNYLNILPLNGNTIQETSFRNLNWVGLGSLNFTEFDYLLKNRQTVDGYVKVCDAPYLINCGTKENFEMFSSLLQSGDYTLDQLLEYMEDGWKSLPRKSWQSIDDGGETAKKVIQSEKGKKYKQKGTKTSKNEDGTITTEKEQEGVGFSSLVSGMQSSSSTGEDSLVSYTPIDDLLGEQTTLPQPYPIPNPGTFPGSGTTTPGPSSPTPTPGPSASPEPGVLPVIPGTDSDIQWYERFPFCIPWDLYNGISTLNAETKVPKFDIPFKIERLGIDETISVDFSKFEPLAAICRWFIRLSFMVGLALLSRYIIKG